MAALTNTITFISNRPKSFSISSIIIQPSLSRLRLNTPKSAGGGVISARYTPGRNYTPRPNPGGGRYNTGGGRYNTGGGYNTGGYKRPKLTRRYDDDDDDTDSDEEYEEIEVDDDEYTEQEPPDLSSISSNTVRLIDQRQNMVGIVTKAVAIKKAMDAGLDLLIISPEAEPPVVRIVDVSKFQYEEQKKKREQQKKASGNRRDQKELKMGYNIDVHDYAVRLKAARKFLTNGDKVKVLVTLKGRQNQFRENAIELLARFKNDLGELATEESRNFRERNLTTVFVPNKVVIEPKKKEKGDSTVVSAENSTNEEISGGEDTAGELSEDDSTIKVSGEVEAVGQL